MFRDAYVPVTRFAPADAGVQDPTFRVLRLSGLCLMDDPGG